MILKGSKIKLRDMQLDDLQTYQHWLSGDFSWKKLNGPYYKKSKGDEVNQYISKKEEAIKKGDLKTPRASMVIADGASNEFIGTVSWYWQSEETYWLSTGLVIYDEAYWGKGLGYEALGLWSDYLFKNMPDIARLDLRSWSGNIGMMRLAEKLGYQLEATFRKARIVEGKYFDGVGYGVLREEWNALYPKGFADSLF